MKTTLPQVVIIGRANVGKSTLFNKLIEKNKALVSSIANTTRDRNIDLVYWRDKSFILTDTGGLDVDEKTANEIDKNIVKQANTAIEKADLILFMVDVKSGILPQDKEIAKQLSKLGHKNKTILIGNKADSLSIRQNAQDIFQLGFDEPQFTSAANSSGTGDLLDLILDRLPKTKKSQKKKSEDKNIKVAIVGKPNVGKSSLLNAILGEDRVIVTPLAHTTRESHDMEFEYRDRKFTLIDTAGISKKSKLNPRSLERKSIEKSLETIEKADVVILVTEAQKKIDAQDKKITQKILEESKSVIIVANKWDLIPDKDTNTINKYQEYYAAQFPYLWWAPVMFISAKNDQRTRKILDMVLEIEASRNKTISNAQLDDFLKSKLKQHRPSRGRGLKNPYIYILRQVAVNPPRIEILVNDPKILHFSYIRFLQNHLREKFKIIGTPIQVEVRKWADVKREEAKEEASGSNNYKKPQSHKPNKR